MASGLSIQAISQYVTMKHSVYTQHFIKSKKLHVSAVRNSHHQPLVQPKHVAFCVQTACFTVTYCINTVGVTHFNTMGTACLNLTLLLVTVRYRIFNWNPFIHNDWSNSYTIIISPLKRAGMVQQVSGWLWDDGSKFDSREGEDQQLVSLPPLRSDHPWVSRYFIRCNAAGAESLSTCCAMINRAGNHRIHCLIVFHGVVPHHRDKFYFYLCWNLVYEPGSWISFHRFFVLNSVEVKESITLYPVQGYSSRLCPFLSVSTVTRTLLQHRITEHSACSKQAKNL
jgi:hypothetical protein